MANVRLDTSGVDDGHYIFNLQRSKLEALSDTSKKI